MEITEVRVFPVQEEKLKAFVSIVLDRCFMVNDIKVIQGKDSLFISMPSRKKRNGEFKDVAHPLNNETRRWVEDRILAEYRAALDGRITPGATPVAEVAEAQTTNETAPQAQPMASSMEEAPSLEEVERRHLNDSFWGVT